MTRARIALALSAALAASLPGLLLAQAAAPATPASTPAAPRAAPAPKPGYSRPMADILKDSKPSEWRTPDPENTLYMELPRGRVVIELAPEFAPLHAENIRTLVRGKYFDGLAIIRSHDNYVVQWGDPEEGEKSRPLGAAKEKLPSEYTAPISADRNFSRLKDADGYAPQVGFSNGFPVGRDPKSGETWLAHCYGALGVARGTEEGTGNGSSLYVVSSHAPRHLDRNIAVVGRVLQGMELLSAMPRGPAPMGFYADAADRTPITSIRMAADVPAAERTALEVLRSDSPSFLATTEARRNRRDDFYIRPAGYIELCNVPIPVRTPPVPESDKASAGK
jgi:cyclophilin family peptidyl-prolyl cis-trans isomerase